MANITCCWELGGFLGHISRFVCLTNQLESEGHKCSFILRDLSRIRLFFDEHKDNVYQAPVWLLKAKGLPQPPMNFAEILQQYGYLDARGLAGLVAGWINLFKQIKPELLLMDYAPTALIAARIMGIKSANFGTGFFVPPKIHPAPKLRDWLEVPEKRLLQSDELVINTINKVLIQYGAKQINSLHDLYDIEEQFFMTLPELDHYQGRDVKYWGHLSQQNTGAIPKWYNNGNRKVFAYIKPESAFFEASIDILAKHHFDSVIFAPNLPDAVISKYKDSSITFSREPVDIAAVAEQCDAALCNAGHDTLINILMNGKPVMLLPTQLEQYILSKRVHEAGIGEFVTADQTTDEFESKLLSVITGTHYYVNAQRYANKYADLYAADPLTAVVNRCLEMIYDKN